MTPEELNRFYLINKDLSRDKEITLLNTAINKLLKEVESLIVNQGDSNVMIESFIQGNYIIYDHTIYEELKKRGYSVSEQTIGFEQDSENYYYLHFKL